MFILSNSLTKHKPDPIIHVEIQIKTLMQLVKQFNCLVSWRLIGVSYLIDLYCVTDKQGILLLLFLLGFFIHKVGKTQTDTQHHAWRRNTQINLCSSSQYK